MTSGLSTSTCFLSMSYHIPLNTLLNV
jgi:hypothetical protein